MKEKILRVLIEKNNYVSGEEIGNILGISRAAVWKNITKLKEMGYKIESISNKGYRFIDNIDVLCENEIEYDKLLFLDEVDSTNNEGKRQANNGCKSRLLIICNNQTAGKGRLGRSWQAEKNAGIYMSMVLRPEIIPQEASQITLVTGIAVMKAINNVTGLNTKIKWPNDIILNGKKIVGILTEMNAEMEKINYVVVGIGINVNNSEFNNDIQDKATSLYIESKRKYKRSDIINEFIKTFDAYYDKFCNEGFEVLVKEYNKNCANVGKAVKTVGGKMEVKGIAKGVNNKGELLIENENQIFNVLSGEVSLRLDNDKYI